MLLGVRLVLYQSLEGERHSSEVLQDILAALWTSLLNVVIFLWCAWIGYFLGIQALNVAFASPAIEELARHYPLNELLRLCLRTGIEASMPVRRHKRNNSLRG